MNTNIHFADEEKKPCLHVKKEHALKILSFKIHCIYINIVNCLEIYWRGKFFRYNIEFS